MDQDILGSQAVHVCCSLTLTSEPDIENLTSSSLDQCLSERNLVKIAVDLWPVAWEHTNEQTLWQKVDKILIRDWGLAEISVEVSGNKVKLDLVHSNHYHVIRESRIWSWMSFKIWESSWTKIQLWKNINEDPIGFSRDMSKSVEKMPYLAMLKNPLKAPGTGSLPKFNQFFPGLMPTCV